jgi:PAS domain S-box-containing protein
MQQALISSENKYRTLVEQSHVGVFIMDEVTIVYANRALADMLGVTEKELVGKSYLELLAPEAIDDTAPLRRAYRTTATSPRTSKAACCMPTASACTRA